jgi:hypothetical protein
MFSNINEKIKLSDETKSLILKLIEVFHNHTYLCMDRFIVECHTSTGKIGDPQGSLRSVKQYSADMLKLIEQIFESMTDEQKISSDNHELEDIRKFLIATMGIEWNSNYKLVLAENMINILTSMTKENNKLKLKISK